MSDPKPRLTDAVLDGIISACAMSPQKLSANELKADYWATAMLVWRKRQRAEALLIREGVPRVEVQP